MFKPSVALSLWSEPYSYSQGQELKCCPLKTLPP